jgi:HAD superfamily hydrolase (TIGR01493 family)
MVASPAYRPYEGLVAAAARELRLPRSAPAALLDGWADMRPWADAGSIARLGIPYAFVTNCSRDLAAVAADRSRLRPRFVLSAEEAGWYKPDRRIYREACRRLGPAPAATMLVAGSSYDREGAARAGLRSALVMRRPDQRPPAPGPWDLPSLADFLERLRDPRSMGW